MRKKWITLSGIVLGMSLIFSGCNQTPSEFYVAANGSDTNPGTMDQPFATIEKARDVVRDMKEELENLRKSLGD